MARITLASVLLLLCAVSPALANHDLFFTEYVEGSSNNKAVENFNPTGATVDLGAGQYLVQVYANGSATPTSTVTLTGTVVSGDVFVVGHTSAGAGITAVADQLSGSLSHNGNDTIVLRKGGAAGTILDVIGQIGFDPGAQWGVDPVATQDNTIRRKDTICEGDPDGSNDFNPGLAAEWDGFVVDTFSGLGTHPIPSCAPTGTQEGTWGAIKLLYR